MGEAAAARAPAGDRVWRLAQPDARATLALSSELGLSRTFAGLLVSRGVATVQAARDFLAKSPGASTDPFDIPDMDRAVTAILGALRRGDRIAVYGDYDVDGLTATALVIHALSAVGGKVSWYIPDRLAEGYGVNAQAIRALKEEGARLVVTVDCGVTALPEAALARSLGLELVITDHHEPLSDLPVATAVVNPRRADSSYPFRDLAGVGVALKLVEALAMIPDFGLFSAGELWEKSLDLVALGTVSDVVPLVGESRSLVFQGLAQLNPARRTGLLALQEAAGLGGKELGTYHLGFQLGPRLNAAGRLGDAARALRLLLTPDPAEAAELAAELDRGNRERQALEERIFVEAVGRVEREIDLETERAIVLSGRGWHEGVIGIVASRLVERFARPALLVAMNGGSGRGSGRSVPAFDLVGALEDCSSRLGRFGGHRMAAGFEIEEAAFGSFSQEFLALARERLSEEDLVRELRIDACVEPWELAPGARGGQGDGAGGLVSELELLEPCGTGNPEPILAMRGVSFSGVRPVGEGGRHLKAVVGAGGQVFEAIGFGLGGLAGALAGGPGSASAGPWDIAFRPGFDTWGGVKRLQLKLIDIKRPSPVTLATGGQ